MYEHYNYENEINHTDATDVFDINELCKSAGYSYA